MMSKHKTTKLDELFAKARKENPVISEDEVDVLLDRGEGIGRYSPSNNGTTTTHNNRGFYMNGIIAAVMAGVLGMGGFYFSQTTSGSPAMVPEHSQLSKEAVVSIDRHQKLSDALPAPQKELQEVEEVKEDTQAAVAETTDNILQLEESVSDVQAKDEAFQELLPKQTIDSVIITNLSEELKGTVEEYWVKRINGYRVLIDEMLSDNDHEALNKLRVRWAIYSATESKGDNSISLSANMSSNGKDGSSEVSMDATIQGSDVDQPRSMSDQEGMQMGLASLFAANQDKEWAKILTEVKELATEYRPGLNDLKATVLDDIDEFFVLLKKQMKEVMEKHGEVVINEEGTTLYEAFKEKAEMDMTEMKPMVAMVYDFIAEPMLMLYNGSDINNFLSSSITEPVTGLTLEENATLSQNYPNPASTSTTITYSLSEPSSSTILRIYDATGSVVNTIDEGQKATGEHKINLDVSGLRSGAYLYHLTIQAPGGEQVYSKALQVVR